MNYELYSSLCASVLKWFKVDRGYKDEISIERSDEQTHIGYPDIVVGASERTAAFYVGIAPQDSGEDKCHCCWFGLSFTFCKIGLRDPNQEEVLGDVLKTINDFNILNGKVKCEYNDITDRIYIQEQMCFYPYSCPSEQEIFKLLDDFFYNKHVEAIASMIRTNEWQRLDGFRRAKQPQKVSQTVIEFYPNSDDIPF